jgi:hypothetical protein
LEDVKEADDSGESTRYRTNVGRMATTGCQIEGEGEWAHGTTNNMPIARSLVSHLNAVNAASAQVYKSYLAWLFRRSYTPLRQPLIPRRGLYRTYHQAMYESAPELTAAELEPSAFSTPNPTFNLFHTLPHSHITCRRPHSWRPQHHQTVSSQHPRTTVLTRYSTR